MPSKNSSLAIRLADGTKEGISPLFVISADCVSKISRLSVADSSDSIDDKKSDKLDAVSKCLQTRHPYATGAEHLLPKAAASLGAPENVSTGYPSDFLGVAGGTQHVPILPCPFPGGQE